MCQGETEDPEMGPILSKRDLLAGAAAAGLSSAAGITSATATAGVAKADRRPVPFGAAANHFVLPTDAPYRAALARHCDILVAEGAMKWDIIRAKREAFDFKHGDDLTAFAEQHGMQVRGHTLVWCEANPPWLKTLASATEAERELRRHIERVVTHYKSSIRSWDVVNEPIAETPRNSMDLRPGVWPALLGERYIDIAFRAANDAAPDQQRVLNEYGIEHATPRDRLKRAGFKRLVYDLKSRGVPITAVGLQAHLDGAEEIDKDGVAAFCRDMTRAGIDVLVTELDVNDFRLPADITRRDEIAAAKVRDFLDAVFAGCRPKLVCTWGLTDRYTWMPMWFKRKDGLANRPLPLDAELKPKPMMQVIAKRLAE
jgi:endo-1,4-beta-xylanase